MNESALGAAMTRLRVLVPLIGPISVTNPFLGFEKPCANTGDDEHPEATNATNTSDSATAFSRLLRGENGVIFNGKPFLIWSH